MLSVNMVLPSLSSVNINRATVSVHNTLELKSRSGFKRIIQICQSSTASSDHRSLTSETHSFQESEKLKAAVMEPKAEGTRKPPSYVASIWGDVFSSMYLDNKELEMYQDEIEQSQEQVRNMLLTTDDKPAEKMSLINTLERLGISYHFENEIEDKLKEFFDAHEGFEEEDDLNTVALQFRLFRQHGYHMLSDVFNKFKDRSGRFKETLTRDIKGMLSLYEAAHVRTHGEDVLEEALVFTTTHLKSMVTTMPHLLNPSLAKQVEHALEQPLHKGMERIEARHYISIYQQEDYRDDTLLRFAKISFNQLQLLYKQELHQLARWWKDLDLIKRLGGEYPRDRLVECYFWMFAVQFEPCYSLARTMGTKIVILLSVIDDIYDNYGTYEDLQAFTAAMQRWDIRAVDQLPDYMKICYAALLDLFNEIEEEMLAQGRSFAVHFNKDALKEVTRSYMKEFKWFFGRQLPSSFEEYMSEALITSTHRVILHSSLMGMGEIASVQVFQWLKDVLKLLTASETICRHFDDVRTFKGEKERGQPFTGIELYMKDNNISEVEEANDELFRRIEDAWKDMNEECLLSFKPNNNNNSAISMHLLIRIVNLARVLEVAYKYIDGYNHPEKALKSHITSLFIQPIPL